MVRPWIPGVISALIGVVATAGSNWIVVTGYQSKFLGPALGLIAVGAFVLAIALFLFAYILPLVERVRFQWPVTLRNSVTTGSPAASQRQGLPARPQSSRTWSYRTIGSENLKLREIVGQEYAYITIGLDGMRYINCVFRYVTFQYDGGHFDLTNVRLEGSSQLTTTSNIAKAVMYVSNQMLLAVIEGKETITREELNPFIVENMEDPGLGQ
jgi:hypothetical protein